MVTALWSVILPSSLPSAGRAAEVAHRPMTEAGFRHWKVHLEREPVTRIALFMTPNNELRYSQPDIDEVFAGWSCVTTDAGRIAELKDLLARTDFARRGVGGYGHQIGLRISFASGAATQVAFFVARESTVSVGSIDKAVRLFPSARLVELDDIVRSALETGEPSGTRECWAGQPPA
ncbi:MAG TPA: hypothetical protein VG939_11305 [Caulobacteraceae bacterium]|nr:hypothetical protein [Caulobacteraceae bacterium]